MRRSLLAILALVLPGNGLAWSDPVHGVVCEIAWQRLDQGARAFVREVRTADPDPTRLFSESCGWADRARYSTHRATREYHYINVAEGADGVSLPRDCPAYDCIPVAVERYAIYLARPAGSTRERIRRAEALKFLAHFVADIHQPLHVARLADLGGNTIRVDWFGESESLHAVWDSGIAGRGGIRYPDSASELAGAVTDELAARWRTTDVIGWADETHALALEHAYRIPDNRQLGEEYQARALPVVRRQLEKAGVRLAMLIELAADGRVEFTVDD